MRCLDGIAVTANAPTGLAACMEETRGLIARGLSLIPPVSADIGGHHDDGYKDWLTAWTRETARLREHVRRLFPEKVGEIVWWNPIGVTATRDEIEECLGACQLAVITVGVWVDSFVGAIQAAGVGAGSGSTEAEPEAGVHVLRRGNQYGAWMAYADLLSEARDGVLVVDPYCDRQTLNLLLYVDAAVPVRILTGSPPSSKTFAVEWAQWKQDRGASSECRTLPRKDISHDRFLQIDDRLFLSGASMNGLGRRTSMLIELDGEEVRRSLHDLLIVDWEKAAPLSTAP